MDTVSINIARVAWRYYQPSSPSPPPGSRPAHPEETRLTLKVPFTNEGGLRQIRSAVAKSGLAIRLVPTSGTSIARLIKTKQCRRPATQERCSTGCVLHDQGMHCQRTDVVYHATCKDCGDTYIGTTARRLKDRVDEHESSYRLNIAASALSTHARNTLGTKGSGTRGERETFLRQRFTIKILDQTHWVAAYKRTSRE